ncbi:MAG: hypothetical protein KIT62_12645 [Cyclobacteriaceae bacterium]|nr:hypothetical protein [Cyclobacteriaceae bacterium]
MKPVSGGKVILYQTARTIFMPRKPTAIQIAWEGDSLIITYLHRFSQHTTTIPCKDVRLEIYKDPYYKIYSRSGFPYYLYISHATDPSVWIEVADYYFTLGKTLKETGKIPAIALGTRELNFVYQYERDWREYQSPRGKLIRVLIPVILVAAFLLLLYFRWGK